MGHVPRAVCEHRPRAALPDALRARSAERTAKDPDFIELQKDREQMRRTRETKSISLNEAERRREKADLEVRIEARKKERAERPRTAADVRDHAEERGCARSGSAAEASQTAGEGSGQSPTAKGDTQADDVGFGDEVILREAEHILSDYIKLSSGEAKA